MLSGVSFHDKEFRPPQDNLHTAAFAHWKQQVSDFNEFLTFCRCVFMSGEDVLASVHSAPNGTELFRCLHALDLNLLFHRLSQNNNKSLSKPLITQVPKKF